MGLFSFLGLGKGNLKAAIRNGAIIIDVRTGTEYDRGHLPDAFNIPAERVMESAERLKAAKKPVIVCCNNGERSGIAVKKLKAAGLKEVYNGGDWKKLVPLVEAS